MKVAAIYARVSSERQREEQTIASQTAALIKFAQDDSYTVPQEWVFEDEGYSGSRLDRPGLERVRDLASEGQIETVLVYSPDRLSRKYAYQVLWLEELGRQGVEVRFIQSPQARTPEERLLVHFQGMIAEYERAQIAERTRRGKRHRAKAGSISVLSGAPYGYQYVRKTQTSEAYYQVIEREAEVVRKVYKLYTQGQLSIGAIVRRLNDEAIPTRRKVSRWERSTVWAMLRNPAYKGTACFGKTEVKEREKITRPLRRRGGYSPRSSANREKPREEWIEIPVPAIVDQQSFELAQEQLEKNKRYSQRRTIEPTLLQGLLVCSECGYALYRSSTRTSKRKLYYYRCTGSDNYRHPNGRVCSNRPVRQDYLDDVIWKQILELLQAPSLIRQEIGRRIEQIQNSNPTKQRRGALSRELARVCTGMGKLLDAYQEDLIQLEQLRQRMPELRKREQALRSELESLEATAADQEIFLRLAAGLESFLTRLRQSADTMSVMERQKVLRLVVKEIHVGRSTIQIKHSIPTNSSDRIGGSTEPPKTPSYLLRSGSQGAALGCYRIALQSGQPIPPSSQDGELQAAIPLGLKKTLDARHGQLVDIHFAKKTKGDWSMSGGFFDQYAIWAFLLGGMSTVSLLMGCVLGVVWNPRVGVTAALTAFGAGALLAALSIELVAPTVMALVGQGHAGTGAETTTRHHAVEAMIALLVGSLVGGILFVLLDSLLNSKGGYLRKAATTIAYFRKQRREYLSDRLKRLSQIEFIRSIPPDQIQMLVDHVRPVSFEEGEQLFDEGTYGDRMFFIEKGSVSLSRGTTALTTLTDGDVLGEIAVLTRAPRTARALATSPVVAIELLKEDFEKLRKQVSELEVAATKIAARRLDELQQRDEERSLLVAEEWALAASGSVTSLPLPTLKEIQDTAQEHNGAALSILLGILLDGIPESFVIGAGFLGLLTAKLASGTPQFFEVIPYTLIAGLFLSNFPEAMSSSIGMKDQGWKTYRIFLMWLSLVIMTAAGAVVGYSVGAEVSHVTIVAIEGLAAGAMLTMIAQTMIPEAVHLGGPSVVGLSTLSGFLAAIAFKLLEG